MTLWSGGVRGLVCALVIVGCAATASAQDAPAGEVSAGWRLLNIPDTFGFGGSQTLPLGWYADVSGNMTRVFSVVGEVSGNYKSFDDNLDFGPLVDVNVSVNVHTFMGGIRASARQKPRFVPFAQALFGLARGSGTVEGHATVAGRPISIDESESASDFAFDAGGGVNFGLTDRIGVRVGASYVRVGGSDGGNAFRFGVGAVIPF